MAGTSGFSFPQPGDSEFPWLGDVLHPAIEQQTIEAVARRRLFRHDGAERVLPMHRSIAEYLAARFLAGRCRQGLSLNRILRLLTAHDGGEPSELRGLYAWLTCLAHEHSELLLDRDPLAVVLYGDVAALGASARKKLLVELRAEAERDPYFRSGDWQQTPFAPFATPQLEPELRELLEDGEAPWRMTVAALDAVATGEPLANLGDLLLSLARDPSRAPVVANRAIQAFGKICSERTDDMRAVLEEILRGEIQDPGDQMRTLLCRTLFPAAMSAAEVIRLIPRPKRNEASSFFHFLRTAFEDLPREQLADLLDALAVWEPEPAKDDRSWYRVLDHHLKAFIARVLTLGLEELGTSIDVSRLYRWLGIHATRDRRLESSILKAEDAISIQRWLTDHPEVHRELYRYVLTEGVDDDLRERRWNLRARCCKQEPPELGPFLLTLAAEEAEDELARILFEQAFTVIQQTEVSPPLLASVWQLAEEQPRFSETLERLRSMPLAGDHEFAVGESQRRAATREEQAAARKEEEQTRARSQRWLLEHLETLVSGEARYQLELLSFSYHNLEDREELGTLAPDQRLAHLWGEEVQDACRRLPRADRRRHPEWIERRLQDLLESEVAMGSQGSATGGGLPRSLEGTAEGGAEASRVRRGARSRRGRPQEIRSPYCLRSTRHSRRVQAALPCRSVDCHRRPADPPVHPRP